MTAIQMEKELLKTWSSLPMDKQQEALDFVQSLSGKDEKPRKPLRSALGLWAGYDISISEEDIKEARREMWGNFPREDV